jgi:hypothetical protein
MSTKTDEILEHSARDFYFPDAWAYVAARGRALANTVPTDAPARPRLYFSTF